MTLRLFNVYGTRSRTSGTYGAVFGVFLAQKLAGRPFTVVGDGMQTRDFTYVTDIADAFYTAAVSDVVQDTRRTGVRKSVGAAVYLRIPDRRRIPIPGAVCTTGELFHNTGRLKLLCGIRNLESACISGEAEPLQVSGDPSQRSKEPAGAGVDRYRQLSEG